MTTSPPHLEAIPLESDDSGTIRIVGSRITLDVLAEAWRAGATPEQIVDQFDSLTLSDVYAIVTWMLRHPEDLAVYLSRRSVQADQLRDQVMQAFPQNDLRERLHARAQQPPRT